MKTTHIQIDRHVLTNLMFNLQPILLQVRGANYGKGHIVGIEMEDGSGFSFNISFLVHRTNKVEKVYLDVRNQASNIVHLVTRVAA